jgi:tetratricopeptide (TPR) repeat protein
LNVEKKVIFHLKKALFYLPDYAEALLKLCNIYFNNNRSEEVENLLDNYNKSNQTVGYIEALISINKGNYDDASGKLSKIITKNSELTYLKTAKEVEEQRSNKRNLSKYLEMLVDRVPENGWYYLELSKLLNPEIDYQRICYLLDTSIELLKGKLEPKISKIEFLWKNSILLKNTKFRKSNEQLIEELEILLITHPNDPSTILLLSEIYIQENSYSDIIRTLDKIYRKDDSNLNFIIGKALFEKKDYEKSIIYLNRIRKDPTYNFDSSFLKSIIFRILKDYKKSISNQKIAYESFDSHLRKLESKYKSLIENNDFQEAKKMIQEKVKARRNMSELCLDLYLHHEKDKGSHFYLSQSINIYSQNHKALYYMGLYHKNRCLNESLTYFIKSLQQEWDFYEGHVQIAECYEGIGQLQEAAKHRKISNQIRS